MSIKKYSSGSWVTVPYRKYETATDTITSLPKTIIGDGQPIISWSMDGNMQVNGTPTPQNPITPAETGDKTANLFDKDNAIIYNAYITSVQWITSTDSRSVKIPCQPNTQYTLSVGETLQVFRIAESANADIVPTASISPITVAYSNISEYTFTTAADTACIIFQGSAGLVNTWLNSLMFEEGATAHSYEPFGYKIPILSNGVTYPIYLSEPIRKINNSVDTAPSTGTATRIIKKVVFDGSVDESWSDLAEVGGRVRYRIQLSDMQLYASTSTNIRCTHYNTGYSISQLNQNTVNNCLCGYDNYVYIYSSDYATLTEFKAFLTANPITVWYVLATATTESFTAPTLPTSGTAQSFDVDTTLKPSEVSLTYHGWHEHIDTKFTTP